MTQGLHSTVSPEGPAPAPLAPVHPATYVSPAPERPVRVGIFDNIDAAQRTVEALQAIGFSKEQITVICSDDMKERHFRAYEHQDPSGTNMPAAVAAGGALGAISAGATVLLAAGATGGLSLLMAGGVSAWAGGVLGGLVGAMMTRGVEKEAANFYSQAVQDGKILIAAEETDPARAAKLARAEDVFATMGALPVQLPEG